MNSKASTLRQWFTPVVARDVGIHHAFQMLGLMEAPHGISYSMGSYRVQSLLEEGGV
jgi:hypothetical protein